MMDDIRDGEGGDCFQACWEAARYMMNNTIDRTEVLIVQGVIIGTSPLNGGKRYWHAWCEAKTSAGWVVLDWNRASPFIGGAIKRTAYYRAAHADQKLIWRYTLVEAAEELFTQKTWGPWAPNWQSYEDESLTRQQPYEIG